MQLDCRQFTLRRRETPRASGRGFRYRAVIRDRPRRSQKAFRRGIPHLRPTRARRGRWRRMAVRRLQSRYLGHRIMIIVHWRQRGRINGGARLCQRGFGFVGCDGESNLVAVRCVIMFLLVCHNLVVLGCGDIEQSQTTCGGLPACCVRSLRSPGARGIPDSGRDAHRGAGCTARMVFKWIPIYFCHGTRAINADEPATVGLLSTSFSAAHNKCTPRNKGS
jgi:hypothetical protein